MRKLYLITVVTANTKNLAAVRAALMPYASKQRLGKNSWVVAAGATASAVHRNIAKNIGADCFVIAIELTANMEWTKKSHEFHYWLKRQLAAVVF